MSCPSIPPRSLACLLLCSGFALPAAFAQLPAFPGAEGFGSIATGGRGGDVYMVTNLAASGAGSFSYGVQNAPAAGRTIIFAVSGHIRLPSGSGGGLTISKSKITVAGQTAPGDGICFWNNTMNLSGNDLVFRNVRWRYGYSAAGGDSVDISGSQRIIFDHCDLMFGTDENMSSFGTAPEHLTFQWSANAWGLYGHSCGGLWKTKHATVHHTLWANNHTRNPKLIGCDVFDWVNNLSFGWDNGFNMAPEITGGSGYTYRVNVRNSWFVHGGSAGDAIYGGGANDDGTNKFKLYMTDAALDGGSAGVLNATKTNYGMVSAVQYDKATTQWTQSLNGDPANPTIGVPVNTVSRNTAYKKILSQVGATRMEVGSRPLRDEITQLLATKTAALQRTPITNPTELNLSTGTGQAALLSTTAPTDTDLDGMPDSWESAVGYNPAVADHNTTLSAAETSASFFPPGSPAGYTRLEEYLHFKAVAHGTVPKNTADSPSFIEIDLRKFTSGFTANPVFSLSRLIRGSASQSGIGGAIVRFTPDTGFSGRAGFDFTVTDSAGDSWTQPCCLLVSTQTQARPVVWVGDGVTNPWDTNTANFSSLTGAVAFKNGDAVTIDDTGSNEPTIKVTGALSPTSLSVGNASKHFTLQGTGSLTAVGPFTKSGPGNLSISNAGPNSFSTATLEAGTLSLATANALGSAPITFTGGTLAFSADQSNALVIDGTVALNPSGSRSMYGAWSGSGTVNLTNTGSNMLTLGGSMTNFSGDLSLGTSTGAIRLYGNTGSANTALDLGSSTVTLHTRNGGTTIHLGSLTGASGTRISGASSVAGTTTFSIGALNTSTLFAGSVTNGGAGPTALTKTGSGTLTLSGNSSHSGATAVNSGSLALLGNFSASPVNVAANATLSGTGTMGNSLTTAAGAILSPGADNGNAIGTLSAASLNLTSPTLRFDLPDTASSAGDRLQATGAVILGGNLNFVFNLVNGSLAPGTYDLTTTTGTLTASGVTLSSNLPADSRQTFTLESSPSGTAPGYVRLVVTGNAGSLTWTGSNGGLWNRETTVAWSGATPATFYNFDAVSFTDTATSGNVTITQPVSPRSISVNNSNARPYTFTGAPITGPTTLVKSGSGALTLTVPQYTLTNCTITSGSPTVTVSSTANLLPGMTVLNSSVPANLPAGTTITAVVNATTLTLSQNAAASSSTDSLIFETRNTFSGGTILNAGSLTLACNTWQYYSSSFPPPSNLYGLGTGPITLNGGTLTLLGHTVDTRYLSGPLPNDLIVPAGKTATLRSAMRGTYLGDTAALRGSLTGAGTLNLVVNYSYGSIVGDWSAFSGTLNVSRPASGANDPRFQLGNDRGLPLSSVNLDQVTLTYTATPPSEGVTIPLGSLSGDATAVIAGAQSGTAPVTWKVGSLNTSTTFAGNFTPYTTAPIGLIKSGSGTWTLTGTGTVSAGIAVENGTLSYGDTATDTLSGNSEISVNPAATLQLNAGAKITGASCEIFSGGTLRGLGILQAPLFSSGTLSIAGGTLAVIGNTNLTGILGFSSLSDRLAITGDLALGGTLQLPASGLSTGRKVLATYSGSLSLGDLSITNVPAAYLAVPDTGVPGEVAVELIDLASWQAWQTASFSSTTSPESQPAADPDNDGMTNLEEFQAGTDPNLNSSFIPLVWSGATANPWDNATTAAWLENSTLRVFRPYRQVIINDTGSNSAAIDLRDTLLPGSVTVNISSKSFTLSGDGSIAGATSLTKSGSNTLTLTTANSFSGPTSITAGTINIQSDTALGTSENGTVVANNARLELQNNITVTGESLTLSGQGGATFYNGALNSKSGTNTWNGPVVLAATGTRIGAQAGATLVVAGQITSAPGSTGLTIRPADMSATVVLSGTNSYSGDTSIVGGILKLGAPNTLPVGSAVKLGLAGVAGKLDLGGFSQEVPAISVASGTGNEITSSAPATLTVNSTSDSVFPAPLTGGVSLAKSGPATLSLGASCSYAGSTIVSAGKLSLNLTQLTTPANLINPASPLALGSATLEIIGKSATASSQSFANLTVPAGAAATIVLSPNGATSLDLTLGDVWSLGANASLFIDLSAGNVSVLSNPPLTGWLLPGVSVKDSTGITGPATVVAGKVVRYVPPTLATDTNDATREFSSQNSIFTNSILDWTNGGLLTNRSVHRLILDSSLSGGTIDMGAASNLLTLTSGEIQFLGTNNLTLIGGQIGVVGSAVSLSTSGTSTLTIGSPFSGGAGSLSVSGTANVILNSPNTFTGGLTVNGGNLKQGVANALGPANGSLTLNSGSIDLNGFATNIGVLSGTGGSITNTSPTSATLTVGNATGGNFAGSISGNIAVTKTGSGTQTLSGSSSYTGITTVTAGTLRSGANNAIGDGNLTLSGGTLDLQSFSDSVEAVSLTSGSISGTTGFLSASSFNLTSGTISASIGGSSATVTKSGSAYTNTATLSGSNSYGGVTTLGTNSGTLAISNGNALGNSPSVDVLGSGTALVIADGVTITGKSITIRGTGANSGGNGSFSGCLTTATNATATWTGSVTLGDGNARLGAGNGGTLQLTGPILGSGTYQNISLSSGSNTSIGTVVLSGANNFTGNISLVRGNLKLAATNTLPATAIIDVGSASVSENTTFDLNGFNQSLAGLKRSSTHATQVSTVTNSSATPATLTLTHSSDLAFSGRLTGNLALVKSGSGKFTLSGTTHSFSGNTILSGGSLSIAAPILPDAASVSIASGAKLILAFAATSPDAIATLTLGGIQVPAGTYNSTHPTYGAFFSGTGSLSVTSGPSLTPFESWINSFQGLSANQKLPTADPDADGISNLLEFVLNGSPTLPDSHILPAVSFTATHAVFTFTRREDSASATSQTFESSTSLIPGSWSSFAITPTPAPEVTLGPLANGIRTVIIQIPIQPANTQPLFGRLKVTQP